MLATSSGGKVAGCWWGGGEECKREHGVKKKPLKLSRRAMERVDNCSINSILPLLSCLFSYFSFYAKVITKVTRSVTSLPFPTLLQNKSQKINDTFHMVSILNFYNIWFVLLFFSRISVKLGFDLPNGFFRTKHVS